MPRIGDNPPPRLNVDAQPHPSAGMATTVVRPDEYTLAQVAQRLQLLFDLLAKFNPQLANLPRLQAGQTVHYPKQGPETASGAAAGGPAGSAARHADAGFDAARNRDRIAPDPAPARPAGPRTIPPYDPVRGPQITNDMWTDEMLTGELTADQLRNVVDPAGLLNARLERRTRPTDASFVSTISGARTPANPSQMSTGEDAQAMLARLRALGYSGEGVVERRPENPVSRIEYGNDPRRHFFVGEFNVGLLLERYAKYPREEADRMTLAELRRAGTG